MEAQSRNLLELHIAAVLFGLAGLFGKWISLAPTLIVLGRTFFAALFLVLLMLARKESFQAKHYKDYLAFIWIGLILAFHWVAFFQSVQLSSVAIAVLTFSSFPLFTSLLAPLFGGDPIQSQDIILSILIIIGVLLVLPDFNFQNQFTKGFIWGLASGISFAVLSLLNKKQVAQYSSRTIAFYQNSVAALVLFPFLLLNPVAISATNWGLLILLGVVFTGISHTLFINGMKTIKAQTASIIASLEPVYGILAALLFLGEIPEWKELLGGLLILGASFYATWKSSN